MSATSGVDAACRQTAIARFVSRFEKPEGGNFVAVREDFSRGEIESELRLVLNDPEFLKNVNSAKFLKFIVAETLDGRGARLKAYTIATLALEREASFDPQANSIVRVQAMRLRELLESYYSGAGASDPVHILLRRGTYQPTFERRAEFEDRSREIVPAEPSTSNKRWRRFGRLAVAAVLALAAGAAVLMTWNAWANLGGGWNFFWPGTVVGSFGEPPSVVINAPEMVGASPQSARLSARLFGSIEEGLSNFHYIFVQSSRFKSRPPVGSGYVVNGRVVDSGNGRSHVTLQLLRAPTGDIVWSRHFDEVDGDDRVGVDRLAKSVVSDLADVDGGAIFADIGEQLRRANAPLHGYACLIGGLEFLKDRSAEQRAALRKCLESEVVADAGNVSAMILLSKLLVLGYLDSTPESLGTTDLTHASQLAERAREIAPMRAATLEALFFSRFYAKRFDDAFSSAAQALLANPNSSVLVAPIASAYISRGSYAVGLALLRPLEATASGPPISAIPFLALAGHMRGDANATFGYAKRGGAAATPLGLVMRIVACHEQGDDPCVIAASAKLRSDFPDFARDIPQAFDRYAMIDSIKTTLLEDLEAAGYTAAAADR